MIFRLLKVSLAQSQQKVNFWVRSRVERFNTGRDGSGYLSECIRGILWQEFSWSLPIVTISNSTFGIGTQDRNWWRVLLKCQCTSFLSIDSKFVGSLPNSFFFYFSILLRWGMQMYVQSYSTECAQKIFMQKSIYFRWKK